MIHIKLDLFTVYLAQPGGGIDVRLGVMIAKTQYVLPRVIGIHYTQTQDYHAIRGRFLSLFFWTWTRTFRLGRARHQDGRPVTAKWA